MTISIICAVFNEEKFLDQCISSVLSQSYTDIELIVVNDGSTDKTGEICDKYVKIDERVKVLHQENLGVSYARANGFLIAKGEYIGFIDGDDYIAPDMYEKLLLLLLENDADISSCNYSLAKSIKPEETILFSQNDAIESLYSFDEQEAKEEIIYLERKFRPFLWDKIYKREIFNKIDFEKYKKIAPIYFFEDILLTPMLLHYSNKVAFTNERLCFYRILQDSLSHNPNSKHYVCRYIVKKALLEFFKEHNYKNAYAWELKSYGNALIKAWLFTAGIKGSRYENIQVCYDKDYINNDVLVEFRKAFKSLVLEADCKLVYKLSFILFRISPRLWYSVAKVFPFTHIDGKGL